MYLSARPGRSDYSKVFAPTVPTVGAFLILTMLRATFHSPGYTRSSEGGFPRQNRVANGSLDRCREEGGASRGAQWRRGGQGRQRRR